MVVVVVVMVVVVMVVVVVVVVMMVVVVVVVPVVVVVAVTLSTRLYHTPCTVTLCSSSRTRAGVVHATRHKRIDDYIPRLMISL